MIKRGISPLIATVLILGFVIVVAVIIMLFGKEFVEKSTQRADVQSDKDMSCVNDVIYEIKSACYSDKGSSRIKILIFNNGNKDLRKFYVRFYESSSKVTDRAVAPEGGSIKQGGSGTLIIDKVGTDKIKKVEMYPSVRHNLKTIVCSTSVATSGELSGDALSSCA